MPETMEKKGGPGVLKKIPTPWKIGFAAFFWLVFISGLHYGLNAEHGSRRIIKMGYMPVITNLACPLLDYASRQGDGPRFSALKFSSFAEMAESLRNDDIQVAFIIAPLAIVLRQQGEDVKVIYIGNRHESTLVAAKSLNIERFEDLEGKTVAVPMRYSGHNLSMLDLIERHGMQGRIKVVEMNPPDMASALASGALPAYYVGEPFAAQTVKSGDSDVVFYVEKVWPGFICNLMLVRNDFIRNDPEIVERLVAGAVGSGAWAEKHPEEAARIASEYWNQELDLVEYALTKPANRIVYDRYLPKEDELKYMAGLMKRFGLAATDDIEGLIDDRFARKAKPGDIERIEDIFSGEK